MAKNSFCCITVGVLLFGLLVQTACESERANPIGVDGNGGCPAGQWDNDTGGSYAYSHDCDPYHGIHFTVYSDGSSTEAKQQLAELAEEIFGELVPEFLISDIEEELRFTEHYTYYIYAQKYIETIRAMGFRNGFYIGAIDCVTVPGYYTGNPSWYLWTTKHEITHVFQFTLTDCPNNAACPTWLGVWFREGQAIHMSGVGARGRVSTLDEYYQWRADESRVNPISIHRWTDFPDPDRGGDYYPMFGLAYTYLVDTKHGHGATINDMKELFQLMADGHSFADAFQQALDMSVPWFKENFYPLMEEYLSRSGEETSRSLKSKMDLFGEMM